MQDISLYGGRTSIIIYIYIFLLCLRSWLKRIYTVMQFVLCPMGWLAVRVTCIYLLKLASDINFYFLYGVAITVTFAKFDP